MSARGLLAAAMLAGTAVIPATPCLARDLTFEERVAAQEAIEQVYYSHQKGATKPFEEALPRAVLESKVRKYLKQSVALEEYWHTPVTAEMLRRETERMARQTRMPDRLRELYEALGNDPVLIQECLARQVLVDRMARSFYSQDRELHAKARADAEALRTEVASTRLDAFAEHPRRTVAKLVELDPGAETRDLGLREVEESPADRSVRHELYSEEFSAVVARPTHAIGEVGPLRERGSHFFFKVVLEEELGELTVASYVVEKTSWDEWWSDVELRLDGRSVTTVASTDLPPAKLGDPDCSGDGSWKAIAGPPEARRYPTALWTGSVMLVWGGSYYDSGFQCLNSGAQYDPVTDSWAPTTTTNAPTGRTEYSAVWTGSEMIIWGGYSDSGFLGSGGRYDPATDTWTATETAGAPTMRSLHTAVWAEDRMVVWGGAGPTGDLDTGGRYDPVSDTWTSTSTAGTPSARTYHTAVWVGGRMVVWGGVAGNGGGYPQTGGRYNPTTNTWTSTSTTDAPSGRGGHTALSTGSQMIVWGGFDGSPTNMGAIYDPGSNAWTEVSLTSAPSAREEHTAVWANDRMIVWGGKNGSTYLDNGASYGPGTDDWISLPAADAPQARSGHGAVWAEGQMIVWGGRNGASTDPGSYLDTGGRYDVAAATWTPTALDSAPLGRVDHTAVWTGNEMIVWGGTNWDSTVAYSNGGRYDPVTDSWTPTSLAVAPEYRFLHEAVWTGDEMIVWGGFGPSGYLDSGGRYDPLSDDWTATTTTGAPDGRERFTAVWTGSEMIVWGGRSDGFDTGFDSGGRYNPETDTWTATPTVDAPQARMDHTAVWTGTEMIVWGGQSIGYGATSGGRYDPVDDTWTATPPLPEPTPFTGPWPGLFEHTAVWSGSQMIVWGGRENFNIWGRDYLYRYNPHLDSWSAFDPYSLSVPIRRYGHTAVWTGSEMIVWGGGGGPFDYTAGGCFLEWGFCWVTTSTSNAPTPRRRHTAIWADGAMIVWGGGAVTAESTGGSYTPCKTADLEAIEVYFRDQPDNGGSVIDQPQEGQQVYPHLRVGVDTLCREIVFFWDILLNSDHQLCWEGTQNSSGEYVFSCADPWTVPNGLNSIRAVLDLLDWIPEWNEDNNDVMRLVSVGTPEIRVEPLALSYSGAGKSEGSSTAALVERRSRGMRSDPLFDLLAKAEQKGTVMIIAALDVPFAPEGYLEKRAVDQQRREIDRAQSAVLDTLAAHDVFVHARFKYIPYLALRVDASALRELAVHPRVSAISEPELRAPSLASSNSVIGADAAWAAGYTGSGQVVAVLDTGVDKTHPFLSTGGNKIVSEACYSTDNPSENATSVCPGGVTPSTAPGSGADCPAEISGCHHGTHVAGIVAGNDGTGPDLGVGPSADIIAIQVFARVDDEASCSPGPTPCTRANDVDIISGLHRVYELRDTFDIAVANMSLSGGQWFDVESCEADLDVAAVKDAIDQLRSVGIATVIASGNDGYTDAMGAPACITTAVSVGATSDWDSVASFSNAASFLDLLAPGVSITSSVPGGGTESWGGTSMAAPHVAGAWAVLRQAAPTATIDEILTALRETGTSVDDQRSGGSVTDMRRINVDQAITHLLHPGEYFTIHNDGEEMLTVSSIELETTGGWISWSPQAPFDVVPGGSKRIVVSIDFPSAPPGQSTRRLLVHSSDAANSPYPGGVDIVVNKGLSHTLSVDLAGAGSGTVTSVPSGIDCGGDCSESYLAGTVVTLTPTEDPGSVFAGWSGDPDCSDGEVTMDADKACTATFDLAPTAPEDLAVDFGPGTGCYVYYDAATWNLVHSGSPESMISGDLDGDGTEELIADLGPGEGIQAYFNGTGWTKLHYLSPEAIATGDLDGNGMDDLIVDFGSGGGLGIYIYYNMTTWSRLHAFSPEQILTGDLDGNASDELIVNFGTGPGLGIYIWYNDTSWSRLHALGPEQMATGDLDGNGSDELLVDFGDGSGRGLYIWWNDTSWERRHALSPEDFITGDMDGNGVEDLIVDFGSGSGRGIYIHWNNTSWTRLHATSPELMAAGDLDDTGQDELIVDFGAGQGRGIYVYWNNTSWSRLHATSPEGLATGQMGSPVKSATVSRAAASEPRGPASRGASRIERGGRR